MPWRSRDHKATDRLLLTRRIRFQNTASFHHVVHSENTQNKNKVKLHLVLPYSRSTCHVGQKLLFTLTQTRILQHACTDTMMACVSENKVKSHSRTVKF